MSGYYVLEGLRPSGIENRTMWCKHSLIVADSLKEAREIFTTSKRAPYIRGSYYRVRIRRIRKNEDVADIPFFGKETEEPV